ncbi:hypothetical protein ACFL09_04585, partial [Planctomycetota bacterium]
MRRVLLIAALLAVPALAAEKADDWWNPAWSHRKRVRVRLPAMGHMAWPLKPAAAAAQDVVPAQALIVTEAPLQAGAQAEIRVVDVGGNMLPAMVSGPDTRGLIRVTFPAQRSIGGTLAGPVTKETKTIELSVGRDRAVTPGLRFHVLGGFDRIATLEIDTVADKTSTAHVLETTVPQIAKGTRVQSETLTGADYFIYYGNPKP